MKVVSRELPYYVNRIKSGEPYSFVRYGDGEWSAAFLHDRRRTSSGSQYLHIPGLKKDMADSLRGIYKDVRYIPSLRPTSIDRSPRQRIINAWLKKNVPAHVVWHDCRVFYRYSKHGRLFPFIEALRDLDLPIVVVGPVRLKRLHNKAFPIAHFIPIPNEDCYKLKSRLIRQCLNIGEPACYLFTAGPAAKVLIYKLFPPLGKQSFLFDMGSLWDIYVGKASRRYHKKMTHETIRRNLTGK